MTEMTSVGVDMAVDEAEINFIVAWDKKEQEEEEDTDFYGGA